MRYFKLISIVLLSLLMSSLAIQAKDRHTVLMLNSYSANSPWSRYMAMPVKSQIFSIDSIRCIEENLSCILVDDEEDYQQRVHKLFDKYERLKPEAIVMIGSFAFTLRDEIKEHWGEVPIILISDKNRYAPVDYYFSGFDGPSDWSMMPKMADLQGKYNFTLVELPFHYADNVKLMVRLFPKADTFQFLSDGIFFNRFLNMELNYLISTEYPQLKYKWVKIDENTVDECEDMVREEMPGVITLLSTWNHKIVNDFGAQSLVSTEESFLDDAKSPIFSFRQAYLYNGAMGGVYPSRAQYNEAVELALSSVLSGVQPKDIPFVYIDKSETILNYKLLEKYGVDMAKCPPNAIFFDKPASMWERHTGHIILSTIILGLLLLIMFIYAEYQRRLVRNLKSHKALIDNMAMPYAKAFIRHDKDGNVLNVSYDLKLINEHFREVVDNLLSKDEKTSMLSQKQMTTWASEIVQTRQPVLSTRHFPSSGLFYRFQIFPVRTYDASKTVKPLHRLKKNPSGVKITEVDVFAYDITDLKRHERELLEANERALESDRMKSEFLASMSHEIRTPLNAIVGFSDLITETEDAESRKMFCEIIKTNNHLLLTIVNDVLDLAKIESNSLDYAYSDFDLNKLVNKVVDKAKKLANENVAVETVIPLEPMIIHSDEVRLTQVLTNLLSNAAKFTREGKIACGYEIHGTELRFFVRDTGIGIDPAFHEEIFQRYRKLDSFSQGTGIGLTISREVVKGLGGIMCVESEGEGKGCEFWFTISFRKVKCKE